MKYSPLLLFVVVLSQAQPLVHQEPHHVPIVETRYLRVLNVNAHRGDTTDYHVHKNDIAYATIKGSRLWLEEFNSEPRTMELPTGWFGSNITHTENPLIHRFANIGENDFQLIAVEILTEKFSNRNFSQIGEKLHENSRFSIQQMNKGMLKSEVPLVLIELEKSGEIGAIDVLKPRQALELVNSSDSSRFVIIQAK